MTAKELKKQERVQNYENQRAALRDQGYQETVLTISVLKANVMAVIITLPIIVVCIMGYTLIHGGFTLLGASGIRGVVNSLLFLAGIVALIVVHELLHGIGWSLFCKNKWKSVIFDVMWDNLTPYCHCKEPLAFGPYLFGAMLPLFVTGFGLFALALWLGSAGVFFLSVLAMIAAGGDLTLALMLLKHRKAAYIMDLPVDIGCSVFSKATANS